jgi:hypothetical protein
MPQVKKALGEFHYKLPNGKTMYRYFGANSNPWSAAFGFPYELQSEHLHGNAGLRLSKTRAYVCVDEGPNGEPVVESWPIRGLNFYPGHEPQLLGPMKVGRDGVVTQNPLTRVKVKSPSQRTKAAPDARLLKRRKTTQKAPPGFYANPTPRLKSPTQPSQREHFNPKTGKMTTRPSKRLQTRRALTHNDAPPGVWANPVPYRNNAKSTRADDPAWIGYAVHRVNSPNSAYAILQSRADAVSYAQKLADQRGIKLGVTRIRYNVAQS